MGHVSKNRAPSLVRKRLVHQQAIESIYLSWSVLSPSIVFDSFASQMPVRLLYPWDFPGKDTGMGCHFLLQGIFPTQGLNSCLLCWQTDSLPLSHWEVFVNIKLLKSYYGNTVVFLFSIPNQGYCLLKVYCES